MARISNLGELDYSDFNRARDDNEVYLVIKLDQPVKVDLQFLKSIAESRGLKKFTLSNLSDNTSVNIPLKGTVRAHNFYGLIPKELLSALVNNTTFENIDVELNNYDRFAEEEWVMDSGSFDVLMRIDLSSKPENLDRILQSTAKKINRWLVKTRRESQTEE